MNFRKVDAGLARALSSATATAEPLKLSVFIRTTDEAGEAEAAVLGDLGLRGVRSGANIYSAELSPRLIGELSEQTWVHSIALSGTSQPASDDDGADHSS